VLISINYKPSKGPYGGGNQFVTGFCKYLDKRHTVCFDLNSNKIDIILIIDPRKVPNVRYTMQDVFNYKKNKNSSAIIVHRINECDERKKTKLMNLRLRIANYLADHTIVLSNFLKKLNLFYNKKKNHITVIHNGQDPKIFKHNKNKNAISSGAKIKLITHHWSPNFMKGHDIYQYLDTLIGTKNWRNKIEFTYIGNYPKNLKYNNTKFIKPLSGKKLATELRKHDVHINASINEPGGNSSGEGAFCGLPLLIRNSGGLTEICDGYGVIFKDKKSFERSLKKLISNISFYKKKMHTYPYTMSYACKKYEKLFDYLIKNRKKYLHKRNNNQNWIMNILFKIGFFNLFL
jgi:glycosyltransferase involved in cell wall biosynthesis